MFLEITPPLLEPPPVSEVSCIPHPPGVLFPPSHAGTTIGLLQLDGFFKTVQVNFARLYSDWADFELQARLHLIGQ